MEINKIINALNKGVETIADIAEFADQLNIPAIDNIAKIVVGLSNVANNVIDRIEEGVLVASTDDLAAIKAIITDLATENDKLIQKIKDS